MKDCNWNGTRKVNSTQAMITILGLMLMFCLNLVAQTTGTLVIGQPAPTQTSQQPLVVDGPPPYQVPTQLPTGFAICPIFQNGHLAMGCQTFLNNNTPTAQYVLSHSGSKATYLGPTYGGDKCPDGGFRDDGDYCAKPDSYGRGAGYPWNGSDGIINPNASMISRCQNDGNPQGCEMNGAIAYPKCKPNFHPVGCCVCSPDCPSGWEDIGVSCKKPHGAASCSKYGVAPGYGEPFTDPRNGGECWVCPAQLPRTKAAVNSTDPYFPACAVENDNAVVWQSPQYPEPGIYAFLNKAIMARAFANPAKVDAYIGQLANGSAATKATLWQQMINSPADSPAFKALIFSAMLGAASDPKASFLEPAATGAFERYIQSRRTFVAQDAYGMYQYYLNINAYKQTQAVGSAIAGGGFSNAITGQLGLAPGNYVSAAYAYAVPDKNGTDFLDAVYKLNKMAMVENASSGTDFDLENLKHVTDTLDPLVEHLEEPLHKIFGVVPTAGFGLGVALAGAAIDFSGEVMTLTAQQDAKNQYSHLVSDAAQPVSIKTIMASGSQQDQGELLMWWALATSPYKASNQAGTNPIASADLCNAYLVVCGEAKNAASAAYAAVSGRTTSVQYATAATSIPIKVAAPTGTPHWTPMIGNALAIGANAKGVLWAIGNDPGANHAIYKFVGTNWQMMPGGATRVAVDPAGNAWVVNSSGNIFRYTGVGSGWQQLPGWASDIAVGANGSVWVIGSGQSIYRLKSPASSQGPYEWERMPGGAVRVAVGPDGNAWVVNAGHQIYRFNGSSWTLLPGAATAIAIDAGGLAYVVGMDGQVYHWMGTNWTQDGTTGENLAGGAAGVAYVTKSVAEKNAIMARAVAP